MQQYIGASPNPQWVPQRPMLREPLENVAVELLPETPLFDIVDHEMTFSVAQHRLATRILRRREEDHLKDLGFRERIRGVGIDIPRAWFQVRS